MFESIIELAMDGHFVTPWINAGGISSPTLVHYMDYHCDSSWDDSYLLYQKALREITPERFIMLPTDIQEAIKNNMRCNRKE